MSKRKRRPTTTEHNDARQIDKKTIRIGFVRILALVAVTAMIFCVYRYLLNCYFFEIVLGIYIFIASALVLAYVIYNRGFSRRGITADMLPDSWSDEKKQEFIADGEKRLSRSRPLLFLIFAFFFTFVVDILELFALPMIQEMFNL